jgi:thiopurine S-methyltransferase
MDRSYWIDKWKSDQIGFHKADVNPMLVAHIDRLDLPEGARIFLPLCGKTRDIGWLLSRGYRVCGAELSVLAVDQLFADLGVEPICASTGSLTHYAADGIDIFVGDIFDVTQAMLGPVDAVYDRAALVALPGDTRHRYAAHLARITGTAPHLLICFEYEQNEMNGPPFAVDETELRRVHGDRYAMTLLERADVAGGLKGRCKADETVWHLY